MLREQTERLLERSGRITPREVLEAYERLDWKPCYVEFHESGEDGERGCAVAVVMQVLGYFDFTRDSDESLDGAIDDFKEARQLTSAIPYIDEFIVGFDNDEPQPPYVGDSLWEIGISWWERRGWLDGQRARRAVEARYG